METKISEFYGTTIYILVDYNTTPNIIAKHVFEDKNETCVFSIKDNTVIKGSFSDDERYDDVKEWITLNRNELMNMWNNNAIYEIGGIE